MDSRALVAVSVGVTGFILGILALIEGATLGFFAGAAALGAGIAGWYITRDLVKAETALAVTQTEAASLQEAVTSQVQARLTAEDAVSSLGSELAETQASEVARAERIEEDLRSELQSDGGTGRNVIIESTALYTEAYFRAAVEARVAAARRHLRPVAVVLMEVTLGDGAGERVPADPEVVASHVLETLRESDTACRTSKGLYALVLEDTPENGAVWTVERIRRRLTEEQHDITVWAGVSCYPAHAFEVKDLVGKASEALEAATEWHQDRIEVAVADA